MSKYKSIEIQQHSFYSELLFSREEKRNAFDANMIAEISQAVKEEGNRSANRCIVIKGKGKCFSAGADLNYMKQMATFSKQENETDSIQLYELFETIYNCPIPTICYVHGASFGGSNGIIAACDYAIAAEQTKFCFSETRLGLLPATISPFVMDKIGEQHALDLFLSARVFLSEEAKKVGLVNKVIDKSNVEQEIKQYVSHFKQVAPKAVKTCKEMIRKVNTMPKAKLKEYTAEQIAAARIGAEGQEGISAFFEQRKADWNNEE